MIVGLDLCSTDTISIPTCCARGTLYGDTYKYAYYREIVFTYIDIHVDIVLGKQKYLKNLVACKLLPPFGRGKLSPLNTLIIVGSRVH